MALSTCQKVFYGIILILTILLAGLIFASIPFSIKPLPRATTTTAKIIISEDGITQFSQDFCSSSPKLFSTQLPMFRTSLMILELFSTTPWITSLLQTVATLLTLILWSYPQDLKFKETLSYCQLVANKLTPRLPLFYPTIKPQLEIT